MSVCCTCGKWDEKKNEIFLEISFIIFTDFYFLPISFYHTVREAWWSFFFEMAGRFRDMYEVVDPHTENFIDSYAYLGAPR